jgi:hypothetical protein
LGNERRNASNDARAIAAKVPFSFVAADTGEIETLLGKAGKGYQAATSA